MTDVEYPYFINRSIRGLFFVFSSGSWETSQSLTAITSLLILGGFVWLQRTYKDRLSLQYSAAILLTIITAPHLLSYDCTLLLIPAILIWQEVPEKRSLWISLFGIYWIVEYLSIPLTTKFAKRDLILQTPLIVLIVLIGIMLYQVHRSLGSAKKIDSETA